MKNKILKSQSTHALLPLCLSVGLLLSGCSSKDDSSEVLPDLEVPSIGASGTSGTNGTTNTGNLDTSADEMRLQGYAGNISLKNQNEEKPVVLGSRLVTGDHIETLVESNAHVVLDKAKILRVNETSQIEIAQEGKHLDIHLKMGTVFFNVTSALTEDESLEFHTNNVVTGVRGTSGIIHFESNESLEMTQIVVLTGSVTGETESGTYTIEAGQIALVETLPDGTVSVTIYEIEEEDPLYYFSDSFVDDIQGDLGGEGDSISLSDMVRESVDYVSLYGEVLSNFSELYADVITITEGDYGAGSYAYELVDIDQDGSMELLIFNKNPYTMMLISAYTLVDGQIVRAPVESFGYNIWAGIQENGLFTSGGKGGWGLYSDAYLQLQDGEFVTLANYYTTFDMDTNQQGIFYEPDQETFESYQAPSYEPKNLVLLLGTPWW